jgi:ribosome-binding factor A
MPREPSGSSRVIPGMSPTRATRKPDRKLMQLCSQVAETLSQVLSGECDDDILRSLHVAAVTPAPDSSQLLVVVAPALAGERVNPPEVLARLSARAGKLRSEVAAAITRRRAPRLVFQYVYSPEN